MRIFGEIVFEIPLYRTASVGCVNTSFSGLNSSAQRLYFELDNISLHRQWRALQRCMFRYDM